MSYTHTWWHWRHCLSQLSLQCSWPSLPTRQQRQMSRIYQNLCPSCQWKWLARILSAFTCSVSSRISQSSKFLGLIVGQFVSKRCSCRSMWQPPSTWKQQMTYINHPCVATLTLSLYPYTVFLLLQNFLESVCQKCLNVHLLLNWADSRLPLQHLTEMSVYVLLSTFFNKLFLRSTLISDSSLDFAHRQSRIF